MCGENRKHGFEWECQRATSGSTPNITDFEKPIFHYHYRCTLVRQGEVVGQGDGSCNSKEKKYEKQSYKVYDLTNTIIKMAQKRALVGAVLSSCGASEFFTQDIEEMGGGK